MSLRVFQTIFVVLGLAVLVHAQQVAFPLTASAQTPQPTANESAFPPFQFLQKPGPYPVGLRVVNQYDASRKSPVLAGDHSKAAESDKGRPLQTLIWYPALPSAIKSMKVGDYVALADTEISFGAPDQEHNKWRTRLKSSFDVPLWAVEAKARDWVRDDSKKDVTGGRGGGGRRPGV